MIASAISANSGSAGMNHEIVICPVCPVAEMLSVSISNDQIFVAGSVWEQIFASHVFTFLSTYDLCIASSSCHFFQYTSQISHLWVDLARKNFSFPYEECEANISNAILSNYRSFNNPTSVNPIANNSISYIRSMNNGINSINSLPSCSSSKEKYARRLQDRNDRYQQAKERAVQSKKTHEKDKKRKVIQSFLDITLYRILIPLPLTSLFLTIVLFTLHSDGVNIPIWGCALPMLFYFVYLIIFSLVACVVYKQRSNALSVLCGLWEHVIGPIKSFYIDTLQGSSFLVSCSVVIIFMCLLQIVFLIIKLTPFGDFHEAIRTINWAVIFVPAWALFILCPVIGCLREPTIFFHGLILLWIPAFIILVCLTVKLNREQMHDTEPYIRLAYIFIPFWIIEGSVMVSALLFLFFGIYSFRLGLIDRLHEHIGILIASWSLFGPFVVAQALLCAYDDNKGNKLTHTETVVPILVLLGWFLVCAVFLSVRSRTPFQDQRSQARRDQAGTQTIFNV